MADCILWDGRFDEKGYGRIGHLYAYRVAYQQSGRHLPPKFDVHHICENPSCVNLRHLVALPRAFHVRLQARFTLGRSFCGDGHKLTPENTYRPKSGRPYCRECLNRRGREYRARKKQRELAAS